MNYYAFHIGDYASATAHLTWEEDLAYRRLLDLYYMREESLPLDHRAVYRLARAASQEQRSAVDAVLEEFFVQNEHGWVHSRCEEEISKAKDKSDKARQSVSKRRDRNQPFYVRNEKSYERRNEPYERKKKPYEGSTPNPNPNPSSSATAPEDRNLEFDAIDAALRQISGIEQHPVFVNPDISSVWQLILSGIDFKTILLPKIKSMVLKAPPGRIKSWGYFAKSIADDFSKADFVPVIQKDEWVKRLVLAREQKLWDPRKWGPMPGQPDCKVPKDLLRASDGIDWQVWRSAA